MAPKPNPFLTLPYAERVALAKRILAHPEMGKPIMREVSRVPEGQHAVEIAAFNRFTLLNAFSSSQDIRSILQQNQQPTVYVRSEIDWEDRIDALLGGPEANPKIYAIDRKDLVWLEKEIFARMKAQNFTPGVDQMGRSQHFSRIMRDAEPNASAGAWEGHTRILITVGLLSGIGRENLCKVLDHESGHLAFAHSKKRRELVLKGAPDHAIYEQGESHELQADSIGGVGDPVAMANALSALRKKIFDRIGKEATEHGQCVIALLAREAPDLLDRNHKEISKDVHPTFVDRIARLLHVSSKDIAQYDIPKFPTTQHSISIADATRVEHPPAIRTITLHDMQCSKTMVPRE